MPAHRPLRQQNVQGCIEECQQCAADSRRAAASARSVPLPADLRRMLLSCAQICRTTARILLSGGAHYAQACEACAEICAACARACDAQGSLSALAQRCDSCAQTCLMLSRSARSA